MSRVFAYCRVSTQDQNPENQRLEIMNAGFAIEPHRIIEEKISGSAPAISRPGFMKLLDRMEKGDILVVSKIDRLGRNAMDVRMTVELLAERKIKVHCLALGSTDLTSSAGKMTMQILSAIAEFEKDLLIERTKAGQARARSQGKVLGRHYKLSEEQTRHALRMIDEGESIAAIARYFRVSRQSILRCKTRKL